MEVFFRHYLELIFEHFPQDIIGRIVEFLKQGLIFNTHSDIINDSCNMLDQFNQLAVKSIENSKAEASGNQIMTEGQKKCVQFLSSNEMGVVSLF
jgi:hypothetical protein